MQMEKKKVKIEKKQQCQFWIWVIMSVILRLILIYFPKNLNLASRPEVSTPLTSLRRLAEGYWLKQSSMSPYAGSMYHGSPLLLSVLGPLTVKRIEGQPTHLFCSLLLVIADIFTAMLIRAIGQNLQVAYVQNMRSVGFIKPSNISEILPSGNIAALVYLWNPFTIASCVGLSTSPIEHVAVTLALYGASARIVPLAAFGWVMATHLSLYPAALIIPIVLLLGRGPDAPPRKLFTRRNNGRDGDSPSTGVYGKKEEVPDQTKLHMVFSWKPVIYFMFWASLWLLYVLTLCYISVKHHGGLGEMFKGTYGFILTIEDLSPNMGVFWYFFAEVFDFFRNFFLIVFHINIVFMIVPLAIRLSHRPCFLAFVYMAIASILKSYPSVGDSALYLGLWGLFINELADMQFTFFLFCGYVGVSLLSPVMHNLWIWRGTGNANFYFATGIAYACFQIVFVVETVGAMLNHDRKLRKQSAMKPEEIKS